jgi:hypothetical protein
MTGGAENPAGRLNPGGGELLPGIAIWSARTRSEANLFGANLFGGPLSRVWYGNKLPNRFIPSLNREIILFLGEVNG